MSAKPQPSSHAAKRAAQRREIERRKAARDARDVEIAEQRRKEQAGHPLLGLDELRRRFGLKK